MAARHRVYLLPGFFGFANLGEVVYFGHVQNFLADEFRNRGVDAEVYPVYTHPTASIRTRARDLLATLVATAGDDGGPIHFIGHSTGGLDARLFMSPGADLGDLENLPPPDLFAQRVRSVITAATPHRGTGLATFFMGLYGARILALLSLFTVYVLRFGRVPLRLGLRLGGALVRADRLLGWKDTIVDQLFDELLGDFSPDRRTSLAAFLAQVSRDQSLVGQLTPQGMDLFNAAATDRPGVRYGSVVTQARPPTARSRMATGWDPYAQVTHSLYAFLYHRADVRPPPAINDVHREQLTRGFGMTPPEAANDGIVPTLSQPWGEVISAVWADHLDVIGHYDDNTTTPPHIDWLISSTGFSTPEFNEVWTRVTDFMLASV
jgi:triacylglycerol lipase